MAKGNQAKEQITKTIIEALGDNFITIQDKKIYTWADENGERVQIAISMTMPKSQISAPEQSNDWREESSNAAPKSKTPIDISAEDRAAIEKLKKRLGIED